MERCSSIHRRTAETDIRVSLDLDGSGLDLLISFDRHKGGRVFGFRVLAVNGEPTGLDQDLAGGFEGLAFDASDPKRRGLRIGTGNRPTP